MNGRQLKEASTLSLLLLMFTATPTVSAVSLGPCEIVFLNRTYNNDGTSTWYYNVTFPAWSNCHWVIAWCGGVESIKGASHPYYYNFVDVVVAVAGPSFPYTTYSGKIFGPVFTYTFDLSVITGNPNKMRASAYTDCPTVTSVTFSWYGPFGPLETPTDDPNELDHTTTIPAPGNEMPSGTYVEEVTVTDALIGSWYVKAEFQGGYHTKTLYDTLEDVPVPWFTSMPLVLLVTVAFLAFLRRRGSTIFRV